MKSEAFSASYTDWHINHAVLYHEQLSLYKGQDLQLILRVPYPPAVYLSAQLFFNIFGISVESARLSMSIFIVIFLLAMFGIGYELGGSYSGVTVMCLGAASPHILNNSRLFLLEFPQTAMTALAFYFLLKTDIFRNRKFSLIFGLVLALSFLTKWSTAFFMSLPILWFFIRIFFFPGNRLSTFLCLFIPAGIAAGGIVRYYIDIEILTSQPGSLPPHWWLTYMLFILLPGAVCFILLYISEKRQNKTEDYDISGSWRLTNFSLMYILFTVLTAPWYLCTAQFIKIKLFSDIFTFGQIHYTNLLQDNIDTTIGFIKTMFNLYPLFLFFPLTGLILIFIIGKTRFCQLLLLSVNIVFISLLMIKIGFPIPRYLLSLVIFTSALGGYWVSYTGKARGIITFIVLAVSSVSILAGTLIPMNSTILYPTGMFPIKENLPMPRILCSQTDYSQPYKFDRLFEIIKPIDKETKSKIMVLRSNNAPLYAGFSELLILETYKRNIQIVESLYWNEFLLKIPEKSADSSPPESSGKKADERARWDFLKELNHILIIFSKDESPETIQNDISTLNPDAGFKSEVIKIADGFYCKVLTPE